MKKNIVIVGLGLIGGSLAKAFTQYTDCRVAGIDTDPAALEAALACGAVTKVGDDNDLRSADIVYLCLYPQADIDFVKGHLSAFSPHTIVTDVCGIKTEVCRALTALSKKGGFPYCGAHPMAGTEKHGFSASRADLFQGASYILVPCSAPAQVQELLRQTAFTLGFGRSVTTTPEEHDQMIAFTSQLPHALACAYVMSPRCLGHRGFSAGSYRDVSRVANINEVMWAELFLDNRAALTAELDTLLENLSDIRSAVAENDRNKLEALLRQGRLIKEELGE
ncbi:MULTISPECIES: prephenate dehydrogenase [Caproicibacterium]|uniref:Prephenate dehydrogenase n=1 Tax=Caproicibacterium argilliputei TaxID=3030016 RepID=A0AA97DBI2_9FIRM|nr:prephenate dehydrogenase [Caproicibacterium argilliputei]WOC32573.1 prephenate dehydrogenase [Caproicibacterium argilliputei]